MTSQADDELPQLASVLRELAWTVHRRVPDLEGATPLPMTELAVLKLVLDEPGTTVGDVARNLGLRQSNASTALRTLVERGLVTRETSPADRRITVLEPTEKAQAQDRAIADAWSGPIRAALSQLSAEHMAAIDTASEALRALDRRLRAQQ